MTPSRGGDPASAPASPPLGESLAERLRRRAAAGPGTPAGDAPPAQPQAAPPPPIALAASGTLAWDAPPIRPTPTGLPLDAVSVIVYLANGRVHGWLSSPRWRVSDTLNVEEQKHLHLQHAALMATLPGDTPVRPDDGDLGVLPEMLVRQNAAVLVVPQDAARGVGHLRETAREWVAKDPVAVMIEAGPFRVFGWAHIPPGGQLVDLLYSRYLSFLPITGALVRRPLRAAPAPAAGPTAAERLIDVVLINREHIQLLAAVPAAVVEEPALPAGAGRTDARQLTALLSQSAVFGAEAPATLGELVSRLTSRGLLEPRVFAPGKVVVRQGDPGNTMYVVTAGNVVVERWHPGLGMHRIAMLGAGDVFGEAAIVREGTRNATVRTVTETEVVAVHREGVNWLMGRSPAITEAITQLLDFRQERSN